jgi:hypothetical protein
MKAQAQRRILDVGTGTVSERSATTLTLNIPPDFDLGTDLSVDADSLGHYASKTGQQRILFVRPSPLSRRSGGEKCLIACAEVDATGASCRRTYRVSEVEMQPPFVG